MESERSSAMELATEELAHTYLPYLAEEKDELTIDGFRQHILDNIDSFRDDGIHHSDDAYALGYYMSINEAMPEILANWDVIVADARKIMKKDES